MVTLDWKDSVTKERLLAAVIGSFESTININEVARLMGDGITYNQIENQLRKVKADAKKLKDEAKGRGAPPPSTPRKVKTPKKVTDGVSSGRVSKTPSKKAGSQNTSPLKKQILDYETDDQFNYGDDELYT
ncbi:hypothetical protein BU24DRAFT_453011 [Aaosphaeria arxii CBS 175.79]|uniref:Uncharacterized protein n=1 Tax=Aaosphaeria arxii CBS 175.79 TaxID=1450172 RepID=A0A6A5XIE1_9PLEO|nr:uncharacterized protein BU24DRAFT_453011 [Aaosphaeria arxii CBS 175.79]KAF2012639.1 hypothetical protein BU24DRAFT_453011 [Aaosphaeria arxii CBS 175.79]